MVYNKWIVGCGLVFAVGCGDSGGTTASGGGTDSASGETTQTGPTSGDPSGPGSATDGSATQGSMSATEGQTTTIGGVTETATATVTMSASATESATDSGTTMGSGPGTDSNTTLPDTGDTGTTGGVCQADLQCGDACCAEGELCVEGQCQKDCGGPPPCGPQQDCCAEGELCHLGACVVPAGPCQQQVCATIEESDCPEGFFCDLDEGLCLPTAADANCQYKPPTAMFEPIPSFTWGTRAKVACADKAQCQIGETCEAGFCKVGWPHLDVAANDMPTHNQSSSIAVVADLDRDCTPEIVFNTYRNLTITSDGVLRAIRGDDGTKVWTNADPAWRTNSTASPAIGDLDGDGFAEIVVEGQGKTVLAFKADGTGLWKSDPFKGATGSGAVAIANIDADGEAEVVFGSALYNSKGKLLYEGVPGIGLNGQGPISCIADLDDDGRPELIAGRTAYTYTGLVANNTLMGKVLWTAAQTDGFCGIADFNGDKKPEVILVANANVYALNGQTGALLAQAPIPNGGRGGPPNIADFDGDGAPEVAAAGSSQYIVYKYNGGNMFTKLWSAATQDGSSQVTGSSVFDFDGDGRNEVVYNDEVYIRIYPGVEPDCQKNPVGPACDGNMTDAEVLFRDRNSSRTRTEYPVIADVDGDFKAEIVFPTNNDSGFKLDAGIEVWGDQRDNWVSTRPIWNQHSYHITNVGLTGEIPVSEPPSWSTPKDEPYNSYRRNAQGEGESVFCAPDLQASNLNVVYDTCPTLDMTVTVANLGCLGVGPGVNVSFYEQTLGYLGTAVTVGPLPAGASEQVKLLFNTNQKPSEIWAIVDEDDKMMGALNECKEGNNKTPTELVCVPEPD